jgi:hypothetical protein
MSTKNNNVEYSDLSRRGLIKLSNDYDKSHNHDLSSFLNEEEDNGHSYERIRLPETFIAKWDDQVKPGLETKLQDGVETMLEKGMDFLSNLGSSKLEDIGGF